MLKKCFRLFKLGSASIDLVLEDTEYMPGSDVKGCFKLKGGWTKQKIKRLECDLISKHNETNTEKMVEAATTILMSKTLEPESCHEIPFAYRLPETLPESEEISYRFHTRVIFEDEIHKKDHDTIKITACTTYQEGI